MRGLKKIRFICEAGLIRAGQRLLPVIPRAWLRIMARAAGTLAFHCSPRLRRITLANLELAYGAALSPRKRQRLARHSFQNTALVMLDLFWFVRQTAARVARHVTVEEPLKQALNSGPVVGATAHFGNWEMLSKALGCMGYAHVAVAMPLINPYAEAHLNAGRSVPGVTIIPRQGAIRKLLRALHQKLHVALLLDQNTRPDEGGVFVQFFGLPCSMSSAAAILAERSGCPILPLFCRLEQNGNYTIYCRPPWPVARSSQHSARTALLHSQTLAAVFENEIRQRPDQWLWMYKRWKYKDPAAPTAPYPFYAKVPHARSKK